MPVLSRIACSVIMSSILIIFGLGFVCAAVLMHGVLRFQWGRFLLKRPVDWHHSNQVPVARIGGAVLVVTVVGIECFIALRHPGVRSATPLRNLCLLVLLAVFGIGFLDDVRPLDWRIRLAGQAALAGIICWCGLGLDTHRIPTLAHTQVFVLLGPLLTLLWLVGLPFSINNIDGVDGLAGSVSLLSTIVVAIVAHRAGHFELLAWGIAGALLAFLCFNFPPARIYLGDSGAYFLGLQLGLFSLINARNGSNLLAMIAPLFVLALPLTDAALTLTRRLLHGLPVTRPDRQHLHHRLLGLDRSPRQVVYGYGALNLVFFGLSLAEVWSGGRWTMGLTFVAVSILLLCASAFQFSRRWFLLHRVIRRAFRVRREVRPALTLARRLKIEAESSPGLDGLWTRLIKAAEHLGFESVTLFENVPTRVWSRTSSSLARATRRYDCSTGHEAAIEFGVAPCPLQGTSQGSHCVATGRCGLARRRCLSNPRAFEIVSELLAEAWRQSTTRCSETRKELLPDGGRSDGAEEIAEAIMPRATETTGSAFRIANPDRV
jgi:UDP-GlcNAc:undecaprenyl-phosphate/decaprenyl-phosphate GlcNAc-1-phosphate transferase